MTPEEIQQRGVAALVRELGPAGMIRFIQQFERGRGDYTAERHEWISQLTLADLIDELRKQRTPPRDEPTE